MVIQIIKLESTFSEEEVLVIAEERAEQFRAFPGLHQKYYVKLDQPNQYGGIYIWDSRESLSAFRQSELAATIPSAYQIVGKPEIEIVPVLFQLRES